MIDVLSVVIGTVVLCVAVGNGRATPLMRVTGVVAGAVAVLAGVAGWAGGLA